MGVALPTTQWVYRGVAIGTGSLVGHLRPLITRQTGITGISNSG